MIDKNLYEDMKNLSGCVYEGNKSMKPKQYVQVGHLKNSDSGFYGEAFSDGNRLVIVYRGTDFNLGKNEVYNDVSSNLGMSVADMPLQTLDARDFYKEMKQKFPQMEVVITGHSLGGSLAQIIGSETGAKTYTYGAYGTNAMSNPAAQHFDNIVNFGDKGDPVFSLNINNQRGKTYVLSDKKPEKGYFLNENLDNSSINISKHYVENLGGVENAYEYFPDTKPEKLAVDYNIDFREVDPDRVMSGEEIGAMSKEEFSKQSEYIRKLHRRGNVVSQARLDEQAKSGDVYLVKGYTRDDGTQVKEYYRRRKASQ